MLANDIIRLFLPILKNMLATTAGFEDVKVLQNNQPTSQGAVVGPALYFSKTFTRPYSPPSEQYDAILGVMHTEYRYESSFQFTALRQEDTEDVNAPTAYDLAIAAMQILTSGNMLRALNAEDVSLYKVTNLSLTYFTDDYNRFEEAPFFDVTFTYKNVVSTDLRVIQSIKQDIKQV